MNYLQKNNVKIGNKPSSRSLIFLFLIFILIVNFTAPTFLTGVLQFIAVPLWKLENKIGDKIFETVGFFRSKSSLMAENATLRGNLELSQAKLLELDQYKKENADLKELNNRKVSDKRILGTIIRKPPYSPYDTLFLDVGENDGVKIGQLVAVGTILIGKVDEVERATSRAKLFSSPGEELTVVLGKNNVYADAYGRGEGNFTLKLPKGLEVSQGDVVSVPSLKLQLLGVVEEIDSQIPDSFQTILFKSPVDQMTLKWVEILVSNK